jgi:hypothetical protein
MWLVVGCKYTNQRFSLRILQPEKRTLAVTRDHHKIRILWCTTAHTLVVVVYQTRKLVQSKFRPSLGCHIGSLSLQIFCSFPT